LSQAERQGVLDVLHCSDHVDEAPATVYAKLLDEGTYLASTWTMYRVLRASAEVRERRRQATHPAAKKPELMATAPNQCWSWDITKLLGPEKWNYFYLYVDLDIFSRYVVGWMLARSEGAKLAEALLSDSIANQGASAGQLTIHADRGTSMASKPVAFLLADSVSSSPTTGLIVPTTTLIRNRTSAPSSTARPSRPASVASKTPIASAGAFSAGTTWTIVIQELGSTPPPMSTTAGPNWCGRNVAWSLTPSTPPIPSASCASPLRRRPCPPWRGSTSPRTTDRHSISMKKLSHKA
jgi:putative transposase